MSVAASLTRVARELGIPAAWLDALIRAESAWNPQAANESSTARGLLQWIDARARELGYRDADDLVARHPTIESQLEGPVLEDLKRWRPFPTLQSLAMTIFYPGFRDVSPATAFPVYVQRVNPGIRTVADYLRRLDPTGELEDLARRGASIGTIALVLLLVVIVWRWIL